MNIVKRSEQFKLDKKSKFKIDEKTGFLTAEARLTRIGVFDYADGCDLRPPEEVFNADSMKSLELTPMTWLHPNNAVTSDNVKSYDVGTTGNDVKKDENIYLKSTIQVRDAAAVNYVKDRLESGQDVQLSCGYECRYDYTEGIHPTEGKYDRIQRDIRYNHVSIVPEGRAGEEVKILLDSLNNKGEEQQMAKTKYTIPEVKLDGFSSSKMTAEITDENKVAFEQLQEKYDAAIDALKNYGGAHVKKADHDKLQGEHDQLKSDHKKLTDKVKQVEDAKMLDEIKPVCDALNVPMDGKSLKQIKIDCIKVGNSDFIEDGKSDDYIDGCFNMIKDNATKIKADSNDRIAAKIASDKIKKDAGIDPSKRKKTDAEEREAAAKAAYNEGRE